MVDRRGVSAVVLCLTCGARIGSLERLMGLMATPVVHCRWVDDVGVPVVLYEGVVNHQLGDSDAGGEGVVWLGWLPSPRVFVSWGLDNPSHRVGRAFEMDEVEVAVPGVGGGGLVSLGGSPDPPVAGGVRPGVTLAGSASRGFRVGVDGPAVDVRFVVMNGPEFLGSGLEDGDGSSWSGRVVLECDRWVFTIDQRRDSHAAVRDLKWVAPFGFTHTGRVTRCDGEGISMDEADRALTLLSYFLSFVRGASVAAVLPYGLDGDGVVVWEDWGSVNRSVARWRTDLSWFDRLSVTRELPALFRGFASRWFNENDQRCCAMRSGTTRRRIVHGHFRRE